MQTLRAIVILGFLFSETIVAKDTLLLPEGKNRELVIQNCVICHSEHIIIQNHMSRERWDATITWMQNKQKLWPLAKETRSKILDYLETYQGILDKRVTDPMDNLGPRNVNPLPKD